MIHKTYMEQIGKRYSIIVCLILAVLAAACKGNDSQAGQYIPDAPDYTDPVMWYVSENDKTGNGADVLYFVSTWEADWTTEDGRICHYADVHNPKHRADMDKEISRIAGYMGENNNFYSPYYRHTTIEAWETLNEDTVRSRFRIPNDDIQNAFAEFLRRRNPQRPFILAGFSQGAKAVVEVLVENSMKAVVDYGMYKFAIAGGVASNTALRAAMKQACEEKGVKFYHPSPIYCTDNAAMIGAAAFYEYLAGTRHGWDLNAVPNLKLGER